ncbi:prephenate dehydrogenase [Nocardioides bigeumensis]|uniref:RNA-binding protein n=1 Tax=Nocardioides bigeumensis TaxID=433657 RepID=A0ABN2YHW9_9ACTN
MGLTHPRDLDAWRAWQARHEPWPRRLRRMWGGRLVRRPTPAPVLTLTPGAAGAPVLVVLDSRTPTSRMALLDPVRHLATSPAVLEVGGTGRVVEPGALGADPDLDSVRVVVALGSYLPAGAAGQAFARSRGLPFVVVQHGLLTPHMAPLPSAAHLLAWSDADAAFWSEGRPDVVTTTVGSQLLWQARRGPSRTAAPGAAPVFLGQLHAAELGRREITRASVSFCRRHGADYRPHPAERDKLSRLQHAWWQRRGIHVSHDDTPVSGIAAPVVSIFSTGVLEAAAHGLPAWTWFPDPPPWLSEFWHRYDLRHWGGPPTPAPAVPDLEPAAAVAAYLEELS